MKIYHNSRIIAVLRRFILNIGGDWLNRLVGINLQEDTHGDINVYPVYRSFRIRKLDRGLLVEIPWYQKQLIILLGFEGIHFTLVEASQLRLSGGGAQNNKGASER